MVSLGRLVVRWGQGRGTGAACCARRGGGKGEEEEEVVVVVVVGWAAWLLGRWRGRRWRRKGGKGGR
jgi:hypothetical protein